MRVTPVGEHSYRLTRWAVLFPVNCYLVREADGFTLIDTMLSGSTRAILDTAKQLGAPIRRVMLTHAHGDHIGSLDALRAQLPNAEVLFTAREVRILDGDRTLDTDEAQGPIRGGYPKVQTRPTRAIAPGDRIGSLVVYAAPGHSPGQVAFLDERDRTFFVGDALSTQGGLAVAGIARPLFPFVKMATWDLATATRTARALREVRAARLAVGHGAPLAEPDAALADAIAVAERALPTTADAGVTARAN